MKPVSKILDDNFLISELTSRDLCHTVNTGRHTPSPSDERGHKIQAYAAAVTNPTRFDTGDGALSTLSSS